MTEPRIKTTVVGSYPAPDWLSEDPTLANVLKATQEVIAVQEEAGLDLVCDGEMYRFDPTHKETNGMIEYFTVPMTGIRNEWTEGEKKTFFKQEGMQFRKKPPGVVEAAVGKGTLDLATPCNRLKEIAKHPIKFTLTGPHMLAKTVTNQYYPGTEELCYAIADVLAEQVATLKADVIQLDEANLPGHPQEAEWALAAINKVLDAVPTTPAVHLCFGNYGGKRIQQGTWDKLLPYFNGLHADHVVLETKNRPEDELNVLKEITEVGLGIGVVDIKSNEVESPDDIARFLDKVENIVGEGRIKYIHPDCGFWMLSKEVSDAKIRNLVKGRDLYLGG